MQCYVCRGEAERIASGFDGERINCPECGPYAISGSALAEMAAGSHTINTDATRAWLADQRERVEPVPMINTQTRIWS